MKKLLLFWILSFSLLNAIAQIAAKDVVISIKNGMVKINETIVTPNWNVKPLIATLGNERQYKGANVLHTFDDKGIVLFETIPIDIPQDTMNEIQVFFSIPAQKNNITPTGVFTGKFMIGNVQLKTDMSYEMLKGKLSDHDLTAAYLSNSYKSTKDGIYFLFEFNEAKTALVKISFGKD